MWTLKNCESIETLTLHYNNAVISGDIDTIKDALSDLLSLRESPIDNELTLEGNANDIELLLSSLYVPRKA